MNGKVAVVTGASGGIGEAVVRRLQTAGARVVGVDRAPGAPGDLAVEADVTTEEGTRAYVSAALDAFGRIDLFHANAGVIGPRADLPESDPEAFDAVLQVNVRGVYLGLRSILAQMRDQGGGAIVASASVAGLRALAGHAPYVASKHAVLGLMKTAAVEGAQYGVRVNAICPGPTATAMIGEIERMASPDDPAAAKGWLAGRSPMNRYATPDEAAALVCWLLSDEASFVNGAAYTLDGGRTAA